MERLSSMKLVPGGEKFGDCCKGMEQRHESVLVSPQHLHRISHKILAKKDLLNSSGITCRVIYILIETGLEEVRN